MVIAIDGPAGAGKSTVAKMLAERLHLRYLDTGAMYRALAVIASRNGLGPHDGDQAAMLLKRYSIRFSEAGHIMVDDEDVSALIRTPEIGELASALSAYTAVRRILVARQKELIEEGGFTLEGRDTTTVVAPHATLKVFLTASLEERAKRRHREFIEKGTEIEYSTLLQQIAERDHRDYTRDDSPLQVAPDAIRIESFGVTQEVIVDQIIDHLHLRGHRV